MLLWSLVFDLLLWSVWPRHQHLCVRSPPAGHLVTLRRRFRGRSRRQHRSVQTNNPIILLLRFKCSLITNLCTNIDRLVQSDQNADWDQWIWIWFMFGLLWNTCLFAWSARLSTLMAVYSLCWPAIIQLENVNMAMLPKPPNHRGDSHHPPRRLMFTLWNLNITFVLLQPKSFYNQVKTTKTKQRGFTSETAERLKL